MYFSFFKTKKMYHVGSFRSFGVNNLNGESKLSLNEVHIFDRMKRTAAHTLQDNHECLILDLVFGMR